MSERFWTLPKILIIQLKRMQVELDKRTFQITHTKIHTNVDFPVHGLDMTKYSHPENPQDINKLYDLFAVVNHQGDNQKGHYTSFVRTSDGSPPVGNP